MSDTLLAALNQYFVLYGAADDAELIALLEPILLASAQDGAQAAGVSVDWTLVNQTAADWAKQHAADLVTGVNATTQDDLAQAISDYAETPGATLQDLMDQIESVMGGNEARAQMIAQTEITRAYAQGGLVSAQTAGLQFKRWQTNNDSLVCEICGPLNQQVIGIDETFDGGDEPLDGPPTHPSCRCWLTYPMSAD